MLHTEQYIAQLIFRHFKGELDAAGKQELEDWLAASSRNRHFLYTLESEKDFFSILDENEWDEKRNVQQIILQKILNKIEEDVPSTFHSPLPTVHSRRWWKYAAAVLLMISAGAAVWFFGKTPKAQEPIIAVAPVEHDVMPGSNKAVLTLSDGRTVFLDPESGQMIQENGIAISNNNGELLYGKSDVAVINKMSTPKGGQYKIVLSDGTRVWLNSASSITYPTFFSSSLREVSVTGEVYFEVAENKKRPFIVSIPGGSKIEVLGTHFNVNVYDDESEQATTLIEGSIRLSKNDQKIMVTPGQQAISKNGDSEGKKFFQLQEADIEQVLAWRNNFFVFNKADIPVVMRQLSRWYDLNIHYNGKIPHRSFQGKIPRDISLSQVLNALEKMEVNFEIKDKILIVSP